MLSGMIEVWTNSGKIDLSKRSELLGVSVRIIRALCTLDRKRSCTRKVRYGHKETAQRGLDAMEARNIKGLEVYRCRHCDGFHIGHKL